MFIWYLVVINSYEYTVLSKSTLIIYKHDNLLFIGNSGVEKTHLTTVIGIEASKRENSVYFIFK